MFLAQLTKRLARPVSASLDADNSLSQARRRVSAVSLSRSVASVTWPGSYGPIGAPHTTHPAHGDALHTPYGVPVKTCSPEAPPRGPSRRIFIPRSLSATPPRSPSLAQPSRLLCKAGHMPRSSRGNLPERGKFCTASEAVICRHCSSAPNRPFGTALGAV